MITHSLLIRQLKKLNLSLDKLPQDLNTWRNFINFVEKVYQEADKERYLLERAMKISSKEMRDLYNNLQQAQEIAKLGIWTYDVQKDHFEWSKNMRNFTGIDTKESQTTLKKFLKIIVSSDKDLFAATFNKAIKNEDSFEIEINIHNENNNSLWLLIIGEARFNKKDNIPIISGISMDISRRKLTEKKLENLHQQLINAARQAGMAEVATSVIHNIGNILNSVNVSVQSLIELHRNQSLNNIHNINTMLLQHRDNLAHFLQNDEKGHLILPYLEEVEIQIQKEYIDFRQELGNLSERIQDIRDIISMQQTLGGVSGVKEKIHLATIIEEALKICGPPFRQRFGINLAIHCSIKKPILIDKSKLSLILINLICNAKESVLMSNKKEKKICINCTAHDNKIIITIEDNGIGIEKSQICQIFTYGYTTKDKGHGFGLNSCATAAKQLNGSLRVESSGKDKGAKFILIFHSS